MIPEQELKLLVAEPIKRIFMNGDVVYIVDGFHHREDGPAIEWSDEYKAWFINGIRHRLDGPAIEWADGTKYWYYHGEEIKCSSQEEFLKLLKLKAFW